MDIENNMVSELVKNEPVDEVINLNESEDVNQEQMIKNQPVDEVHVLSDDSENNHVPSGDDSEHLANTNNANMMNNDFNQASKWDGYNPQDYVNLNIDQEIKDIFSYINDYNPESIEIDTFLKPFVPEYIPAIGEVDAFLKIPRPDEEQDKLGIGVIDEPKLNQSSKAILRQIMKDHSLLPSASFKEVHSIENAHKNGKEIAKWVRELDNIGSRNAAPTVTYSGKMPAVDTLMQVGPL